MKKNSNYMLFIGIGFANAVVLYIISILFPNFVVMGNNSLSSVAASVITGFLLSAVTGLPEPVIIALGYKTKNVLILTGIYFIFNVVGLWILARFANLVGFGVTSFVVVIVLGFILNLVQYFVWKKMTGEEKK